MGAHIAAYLHAAAAAAGEADPPPLFLCEGRATTAPQASRRVSSIAAALTQRLGLQPGDRVCLAALATDRCLEALLAVTAAGGIAAPLNWRWGAAEAAGAASLVGARLLACDAACLPFGLGLAAAQRGGSVSGLLLLGPFEGYRQADLQAAQGLGLAVFFAESLVSDGPSASLAVESAPGNAALIVYTSGTTGKPKGVTLSHAALHAQSMAKLLMCGYSARDVYLHAAPLFHIGGLSSALAMLAVGARHVFLPRFDGAALLAAIQDHGVTSFIAVPTMVADLLAAASSAGTAALPSVTRILVGGGGMSPALQHGLAALCPAATVHTAYGMTEGASSLTFHTLWGPQGSSNSSMAAAGAAAGPAAAAAAEAGPSGGVYVGRPPPGIELAVYQPPGLALAAAAGSQLGAAAAGVSGGDGGGRIVSAGEGEVLTRGPHVMLGYWDDDDATAAAQLPGGWLRTGDLGCLRQGRLWLMGRAKDMIKSGGENVHAWEVERALSTHPAVHAAAVVGVADWRLGEAVAAAVVLRPGWRWAGERCQALLAGAAGGRGGGARSSRAAAQSALAAAAAAVAPVAPGGVDGEEGDEGQQAAGSLYAEDLRSTLLQRSPSRAGSPTGPGLRGLAGGPAAAAAVAEAFPRGRRPLHPPGALQQLAAVAAGLEKAAAAAGSPAAGSSAAGRSLAGFLASSSLGVAASSGGGPSSTIGGSQGAGGGSGEAEDGQEGARTVDGRVLQQHCRSAAGLAGFKLPRVFLLCDAAAAGPAPAPAGSGKVLLPVNSSGKVVKHLLRQTVQQHMAAMPASGTSGAGGGSSAGKGQPRSRM